MLLRAKQISDAAAWFDAFNRDSVLQEELLRRIKEQLKDKGVDETGEVIGYYSFFTSLINPAKVFNTHYTFVDTGDFFNSMFVQWFPGFILIDGNGQKEDDNLFDKYGDGIIGPTEETKEWLIGAVKIKFIDYVKRVLYGY